MKNICHSDNDLMNISSLFTHLIVTFLYIYVVFKMELNDLLMYKYIKVMYGEACI